MNLTSTQQVRKAEFQKNIDFYSKPQAPVKKGAGGAGAARKRLKNKKYNKKLPNIGEFFFYIFHKRIFAPH